MQEYVVGFLFSKKGQKVALIEKKRPEWQAGKLNGIGGKIEPNDRNPVFAMVREFREETGVFIPTTRWRKLCVLEGPDWKVHFFYAPSTLLFRLRSVTDEQVGIYPVNPLPDNVIPNLRTLIPMCLDKKLTKGFILKEDKPGELLYIQGSPS